MNDTVNVPRGWLEKMLADDRLFSFERDEIRAMLADAPKAEPVGFSVDDLAREIRTVDDGSLGAVELAEALMPFLCRAKPESPMVEQEPTAWASQETLRLLEGGMNGFVWAHEVPEGATVPLYTKPTPASDELLEALEPICREADCWPELTDDDVLSFATPEGSASPYDIKMGDIRRIAAIAKHKGQAK